MAPPRSKSHRKSSRTTHHHSNHRQTLSLQKTEIIINVYDLLAPGRFSSALWYLGTSLLHSGVVINGKEYAYGGHDRRGITGVYWTKPRSEPPGGTFRCEILHGFTLATPEEIESIIHTASQEFLGTSYNLLTKNCNHFTAFLCLKLTGRAGPTWLNRAASIGVALPCVVPHEWIEPPEYDTADGSLLNNDDDDSISDRYEDDVHDERARMLRGPAEHSEVHLIGETPRASTSSGELSGWDGDDNAGRLGRSKGKGRAPPMRDADGHSLPPSERVRI